MRGWRGHGREAIAYVFPDHRPFFERAAVEIEKPTTLLLGAIGTLREYECIADHVGEGDLDRNALVIARALGERGFSILAQQSTRLLGVGRALTAYVSPDAAAALARFAANRTAHPILRAYFARHPDLAEALEPLVDAADRTLRSGARALVA
ncbi:MAG: hypothetical protein H0V17_19490 [Deltaproteobacteria bacterium]|nr:hypothetical protein [Deltaproteobacteria bacterium]